MTSAAPGWTLALVAFTAAAVATALPPIRTVPRPAAPRGHPRRPVPKPHLASVGSGLAAAVAVSLLVPGAVGFLLAAVVGLATWRGVSRLEPAAVRRRREGLTATLPLVVDLLAAVLSAGQAPPQALELVTQVMEEPMRSELSALSARLRLGADPLGVWAELAAAPTPLQPLGRTLTRSLRSGASVAEAMRNLADDLRQERRSVVESRARAVGVRASVPMGLCLLPAFVLIGVVPLVVGSVSLVLTR